MPSITLTVIEGPLNGHKYRFHAPCTIDVGRAVNCHLQLPPDERTYAISRHHCRLEVQPPLIHIRDLGSKNGTYVNGTNIGCRLTDTPPEDWQTATGDAVALRNGDCIGLGDVLLQVELDESHVSACRSCTSAEARGAESSRRNLEARMA